MIYHVPKLRETNNHAGARTMDSAQQTERDKSRPYAVRQMPTLSRLMKDTRLKGMFLLAITI